MALGVGGLVPGHPALAGSQLLFAGGLVLLKDLDLLLAPLQLLPAIGELFITLREHRFALVQLLAAGIQFLADSLQAVFCDLGIRDKLLLCGNDLLPQGGSLRLKGFLRGLQLTHGLSCLSLYALVGLLGELQRLLPRRLGRRAVSSTLS